MDRLKRYYRHCGRLVGIEYLVYPPNYVPGDGYTKHKTISRATRKAQALGKGAGISKNTKRRSRDGCTIYQTEKTWVIA